MSVSSSYPGAGLLGRRAERAALDRLLDRAREGSSAVLVMRGESGIGKTALLEYAADRASDFRILRAWGVESEMELPFAGLHQLCLPMLGRLDPLPGPQRDALRTAFGMRDGTAPSRFLVGLAVLSLLADTAEDQPLACLVDDAQWLDRVSVSADRRAAHRALAEATDPSVDPDRRAWHLGYATAGPSEAVAAELERSAGRAQARGGAAAAAALLERAAELSADPARHAARALTAAQAKFEAGAADAAYKLLAAAQAGPLDDLQRATLERLRARLTYSQRRGSDAPPLLLSAARRLAPLDAGLARETYLEAIAAAIYVGRLGSDRLTEAAEAALAAPAAQRPPRALDILLDGVAARFTHGYAASVPQLKRALHAFRQGEDHREDDTRWLWLASRVAEDLCDDKAGVELVTRQVRLARAAGELTILPIALTYQAGLCVDFGEFAAAAALTEEAGSIARATGTPPHFSLLLAATRGQEARALELIDASVRDATDRGEGRVITRAEYAAAVLHNGLSHYDRAFAAAQRASEHDELNAFAPALIELIEAGTRIGEREAAAAALEVLAERTSACGTEWALGIEARSRALLSDGQAADASYREAIRRLDRSRMAVHLARARLLYGEWLRRENRRQDAREPLRTAYETLSRIGADGFAERARRELLATGESVRKRTVEALTDLTTQEAQIAKLAREGYSNQEIAAQLFISPRTVEWHLGNVFTKLGITSRKDLR